MKKFAMVFMSMLLMVLGSVNVAKAAVNEPKDFVGKWTATIIGLPDGDIKMKRGKPRKRETQNW